MKQHAFVLIAALLFGIPAFVEAQSTPAYLRTIAYRNAPTFIEEVEPGFVPSRKYDQILPIDFDNDWSTGNNAYNMNVGFVPNAIPKIYYSIVETGLTSDEGYYLIGYYFYHSMDGGQNVAGIYHPGHEHDMEGVWLVVKKSPFYPYGLLVGATTQAHGALLPFAPYTPPTSPAILPIGGPGPVGWLESWFDGRYNSYRPVFGIRAMTHGTYPLQKIGYGTTVGFTFNQYTGLYEIYPHNGTTMIGYEPTKAPDDNPEALFALAPNQQQGGVRYTLEELSQSGYWQNKSNSLTFGGTPITLASPPEFTPVQALPSFIDSQGHTGEADAIWHWVGIDDPFAGCHWYSFQDDNTLHCDVAAPSMRGSSWGATLSNAAAEAINRFSGLGTGITLPQRYNPYVANPPSPGIQPSACANDVPGCVFTADISGPQSVGADGGTWSAVITGGRAPFRYEWSGLGTGTSSSITLYPTGNGDLYLDVYDAGGRHVALSIFVTAPASGCPNGEIIC